MTIASTADKPEQPKPATALSNALIESEAIKKLVDLAAAEITLATRLMADSLLEHSPMRATEDSLRRISDANSRIRLAGTKLTVVTNALKSEVRDRDLLDHRFAAAIEQNERTSHAALHDALTGLPNRALFNDRLQVAISQAKRNGWAVAVMFIDLDHFKAINDSFGHATGDRILQAVALRLKAHTRADDTASRYGGDEFLYLANHVRDEGSIEFVAHKLIKEIQMPLTITVSEQNTFAGNISASIGIAIFPKDGSSPDSLIRNADAAMYHAKQSHRRVSFAQ
jgi:diguanylate cyclase (GGDEF)-like protein